MIKRTKVRKIKEYINRTVEQWIGRQNDRQNDRTMDR